jgi:hypothetical protein
VAIYIEAARAELQRLREAVAEHYSTILAARRACARAAAKSAFAGFSADSSGGARAERGAFSPSPPPPTAFADGASNAVAAPKKGGDGGVPLCCGVLEKRRLHFAWSWPDRFIVLRADRPEMAYYKSQQDFEKGQAPRGTFSLANAAINSTIHDHTSNIVAAVTPLPSAGGAAPNERRAFCITVRFPAVSTGGVGEPPVLELCAPNELAHRCWADALRAASCAAPVAHLLAGPARDRTWALRAAVLLVSAQAASGGGAALGGDGVSASVLVSRSSLHGGGGGGGGHRSSTHQHHASGHVHVPRLLGLTGRDLTIAVAQFLQSCGEAFVKSRFLAGTRSFVALTEPQQAAVLSAIAAAALELATSLVSTVEGAAAGGAVGSVANVCSLSASPAASVPQTPMVPGFNLAEAASALVDGEAGEVFSHLDAPLRALLTASAEMWLVNLPEQFACGGVGPNLRVLSYVKASLAQYAHKLAHLRVPALAFPATRWTEDLHEHLMVVAHHAALEAFEHAMLRKRSVNRFAVRNDAPHLVAVHNATAAAFFGKAAALTADVEARLLRRKGRVERFLFDRATQDDPARDLVAGKTLGEQPLDASYVPLVSLRYAWTGPRVHPALLCHLDSLEKVMEGVAPVVAARLKKNGKYRLTEDEILAVVLYSYEKKADDDGEGYNVYQRLNSLLREVVPSDFKPTRFVSRAESHESLRSLTTSPAPQLPAAMSSVASMSQMSMAATPTTRRGADVASDVENLWRALKPFRYFLTKALEKLPPVADGDQLYRGIPDADDTIKNTYTVGTHVQFSAYTSTTRRFETSMRFADRGSAASGSGSATQTAATGPCTGVVLQIAAAAGTVCGRRLVHYSCYPTEDEVLLECNLSLTVLRHEQVKVPRSNPPRYVRLITLQQLR